MGLWYPSKCDQCIWSQEYTGLFLPCVSGPGSRNSQQLWQLICHFRASSDIATVGNTDCIGKKAGRELLDPKSVYTVVKFVRTNFQSSIDKVWVFLSNGGFILMLNSIKGHCRTWNFWMTFVTATYYPEHVPLRCCTTYGSNLKHSIFLQCRSLLGWNIFSIMRSKPPKIVWGVARKEYICTLSDNRLTATDSPPNHR